MKVRMKVSRAGVDFSNKIDDEITVTAEEGKALCESGQAEPVKTNKVEKAASRTKAEE